MKLVYFVQYYFPEKAAGLQLVKDLLEGFVRGGFDVKLFTPTPTRGVTEEERKESKKNESLYNEKLTIHRMALYREGKGFIPRAFRYIIFSLECFMKGLTEPCEVIFTGSGPPSQGVICGLVRKLTKKKFIYNLQDIFPDSLINGGITSEGSLIWKIGRRMENFTYKNADAIIVISDDFKANIMAKGVPEEKIVVVPNWVNTKKLSPDVVMLHQIETFASIIYMLKGLYKKYPTIADSHMLRMSSGNRFAKIYNQCFRKVITPKIVKHQIPVVRTQDDDYVNSVLGIPTNLTPFISFGSDQILFHKDETVRASFRRENNIPEDAFVVVYTGKMDEAKGGQLLADAVKRRFVTKNGRDVVFAIVGNTYSNTYGQKVEETFKESENRIIRFPTQRFVDLPKFYQAADLSVFARQCSLSFYDVQACGLPVVFENNNINIDRASHHNGMTFLAGDVEK